MAKLKDGIISTIERKMHSHTIEQDNMDRSVKKEVKDLDEGVEKAKELAKNEFNEQINKRDELKKKLDSTLDEDEKSKLLTELNSMDALLVKRLNEEALGQDSAL